MTSTSGSPPGTGGAGAAGEAALRLPRTGRPQPYHPHPGHPDRDGYFFAPTILTGVAEGTPIVDEEQFGPAVPVIPYRNLDDAVTRANDTRYGLSGSVWSADPDRAAAVAGRPECGTAFVSDHLTLQPYIPFGRMKWSGMGVENGPWGPEEFTALQVLYRSRG
jgi:acyl-CoA reductase-like NAD-dependent aldehyde dehydrogenase